MKHQITTSVTINADLESVWDTFSDFKDYPNWNPFIKNLQGTIEVGKKFRASIGDMKFSPVTKVFKEKEEFTWLGHLGIPGIFDGRHSFIFKRNDDGSTTMIQQEKFGGILVPFVKKKLDTEIIEGFKAMNTKLKQIVEAKKH